MKLSEVVKVWEFLREKPIEDRWFCDLEQAIDTVVGVENDLIMKQPGESR